MMNQKTRYCIKCNLLVIILFGLTLRIEAKEVNNHSLIDDSSNYTIALFTSPTVTTPDGFFYDQPMMDTLSKWGYNVDFVYTTDKCFSAEKLNRYNLIIIARGSRSGNFRDTELWAQVEAPVLCLSGYMVFPDFLNLIGSGNLQGPNGDDLFNIDRTQVQHVNVGDMNDTSFYNIDIQQNQIPYNTWIYDFITYDSASFVAENNGKLLASYTGLDSALGNKCVAMARWSPDIITHAAGVIPKGYRTYMQMGTDNNVSPDILNHFQFTEESYLLFKNEMQYLISLYDPSSANTNVASPCDDTGIRQMHINGVVQPGYRGAYESPLYWSELQTAEIKIFLTDHKARVDTMLYYDDHKYIEFYVIAEDDTSKQKCIIYTVDYVPSGSDEYAEKQKMFVYPNPAQDFIYIEVEIQQKKTISIFSISGRLISRISSYNKQTVLDIQMLSTGFYFLEIRSTSSISTCSFIKQHF